MAKSPLANLFRSSKPATLSETIRKKLEADRAELASWTELHAQNALDAESGVPGADAALAKSAQSMAEVQARMATREAALGAASSKEEQEQRAAQKAVRDSAIAACGKHLSRREQAAQQFATSLRDTIGHLDELFKATRAAKKAAPDNHFPDGSLGNEPKLVDALRYEISRLGGTEYGWMLGGKFPKNHIFDPNRMMQPTAGLVQKNLAENVRDANAFALKEMKR